MTSGMPDIDGRTALLAEWYGDPRFTDADTPSPRYIERLRDNHAALLCNATLQDPT